MAELLYRLGRFSARRAWLVITGWIAALAIAGGSYLIWGGTVSDSIDIPGTPTAEVTERLQSEFASASGGSGTVVFHTEDGSALTDEQRAQVSAAVAAAGEVDGVSTTVDPFASEAQRAEQTAQLEKSREQLEQGRAQAEQGQAQIDEARTQLEQQAAAAAQAAADLLDEQQAQIDAGIEALESQQAQLDAGLEQLAAGEPQLAAGEALLEMAAGVRTVSEDGSAAVATIMFEDPLMEITPETKEAVVDAIEGEEADGVRADFSSALVAGVPNLGGVAEMIGVAVAFIVLMVMLGTLIAAGMPLITALVGVGIGAAGTMALSSAIEMLSVTPILGVMLGLAVGIDYSLFIVNRHRRQLREGADVHESIGLANGTSGNAVVFAGSTVLIALLALNITGIPFLGLMGTVAACCIAIAVLIAVTLTPALLGLLGRRVLPRRHREAAPVTPHPDLKPMATWKAVLRVVVGIVALGVIAIPALSMRLGLPDGSQDAVDSTQYQSYTITAEKFGDGVNSPLLVIADVPDGQDEAALTAAQAAIGQAIMTQDDVVAVAPIGASADGGMLAFQVVPAEGPNAASTEDLVHVLRDLQVDGQTEGTLEVAGNASGNIDISEKLAAALPIYLVVVIGLSLIILVIVFRSLVVPLVATAGFILSVFAAFGGVTAIYQWGWLGSIFGVHDPGPVLNFLPTILVGILFGLAMDYQLFLTSGMREAYAHGSPARRAVVEGVRAGRSVVTAAAIIMISVFGGFVFSHTAIIRPIGFALAFGVLVDAFVVRMWIMPAVMHLAGEKAWWLPKWLDRILPDVDVEGARLERRHHATAATATTAAGAEGGAGAGTAVGAQGEAGTGTATGATMVQTAGRTADCPTPGTHPLGGRRGSDGR